MPSWASCITVYVWNEVIKILRGPLIFLRIMVSIIPRRVVGSWSPRIPLARLFRAPLSPPSPLLTSVGHKPMAIGDALTVPLMCMCVFHTRIRLIFNIGFLKMKWKFGDFMDVGILSSIWIYRLDWIVIEIKKEWSVVLGDFSNARRKVMRFEISFFFQVINLFWKISCIGTKIVWGYILGAQQWAKWGLSIKMRI